MRRYWLLIALLAALAALALTFDSLLLRAGQALPGTPEQGALALQSVWWPQYSVQVPDSLTIHSYLTAPLLANHLRAMPVLQSGLFALLKPLLGPVLALNALFWASLLATQLLTTAYLRTKAVPWLPAALGGLMLVLAPWYTEALASVDLIGAGLWALPLVFLATDRWLARPTTARGAWLVVALYAAVLSGAQHLIWIVVLWLPYVWWQRRDEAHPVAPLGGLMLVFLALLFIYPLPGVLRSLAGAEPAYAPPFGAPGLNRSPVKWVALTGPVIVLAGLATALLRRVGREVGFWLAAGAVLLVLGFGPVPDPLHVVLVGLGLPYRPLAAQAFFFGPALFAGVAAAALGWREAWGGWTQGVAPWGVAGAALVLAVGLNPVALRGLPTHIVEAPAFYREIAAEPEDYVLLEVPAGLWSAADDRAVGEGAYLSRYVVWHHKRTASGAVAYSERVLPDPTADADTLADAVNGWRIGYVVAHPHLLDAEALAALDALVAESAALCPSVERDGLVVYRAQWHPAGCDAP